MSKQSSFTVQGLKATSHQQTDSSCLQRTICAYVLPSYKITKFRNYKILITILTRNTFCRTRSLSNATFSFLITWRSPSSKSAAVYKISSKSDDFSLRYGNITIFKMAAVRHLGIVLPPYETTHEVSVAGRSCLSNFMSIWHRSEDIASWIFRIFGLKCLFRPLKWGVLGDFNL